MVEESEEDLKEYEDEGFVENVTDCPGCKQPCGHQVLRERKAGNGTDYLLKCDECDHIHNVQIREPKAITIPFLLSEGANTMVANLSLIHISEPTRPY